MSGLQMVRYYLQKIYICNILSELLSYVFILKEAVRIQALLAECRLTCRCIYRLVFYRHLTPINLHSPICL